MLFTILYKNKEKDLTKLVIYDKVNNIFNQEKLKNQNHTLYSKLYQVVCPKLVKNSVEIFKNNSDKQSYKIENTKTILEDYFKLLDQIKYSFLISEETKEMFQTKIVDYFDTIVSKTILLWFVNIENIFKFIINNYRCLSTVLELI